MYEAASPPAPGIQDYLRHPTPMLLADGRRRAPEFARMLGLCLLIALVTGPLSAVVSSVGEADNRLDDVAPVVVVVAGILVAPLLEELTFRLPLAPLRPWWLLVSAAGLTLVQPWLGALALVAAATVVLVPALRRGARRLWQERFPPVFFASAMFFGLVHATNWRFDRPALGVLLIPLLVLPQALIGLVFGYTRVRMGLRRAMLLHAAYNGTVLGLAAVLTLAG